jgi:trypsin-like peptidase
MAIVRTEKIVPVGEFVSGLQGAARSIVRVVGEQPFSQGTGGTGTGWFIAANLVVVAGFAVAPNQRASKNLRVQTFDGEKLQWEAEIVGAPETLAHGLLPQAPTEAAVALLRVREERPECVLSLRFDLRPEEEESVTIIHFPEGKPSVGISFGRVRNADDLLISYDANTVPGASGAPVLDQQWRVVAMHVLADFNQKLNKGLTRSALLHALRQSPLWPEIARQHRIADDIAAQQKLQAGVVTPQSAAVDPVLIQAALSPSLDPQSLSEDEISRLRAHVADPGAKRWALRPPRIGETLSSRSVQSSS